MDDVTILGIVAGTLTTSALLPQILQTWRTRSARDVSLPMFVVFCAGISLWLVYGLILGALPLILANGVSLVLGLSMVALKLRFG
ncbi:MAG: SemiSWEET transporter [Euryarchaeota archaeon]|jgi:MtN3 and saliva related transmembrane protein|nr:SemiSWEET transporter [Euryarchaeota archaeon]